jgi:hypothetical protein
MHEQHLVFKQGGRKKITGWAGSFWQDKEQDKII